MLDWFLVLEILIAIIWFVVVLLIGSLTSLVWLFYVQEKFVKKQKYILLEIKIPEQIKKPVESIEQLFHASWTLRENPKGKDKWIEGKHTLSYSCEIVSIEGSIHFFLRIPKTEKSFFESVLYSEFPGLEIFEKDDYVNLVPSSIPNQNWDIEINDFVFKKEHCHPIVFYSEFDQGYTSEKEQKLSDTKVGLGKDEEEKIIDPIAFFLEEMSKIGKREHFWFQIIITPIDKEIPWKKKGEEIIKAGGKEKKSEPFLKELIKALKNFWEKGLFYEKSSNKNQEKPDLLGKEKEAIKRIEKKIRKYGFECVLRGAYIAHRDVFFKAKANIFKNYLFSLSSPYSNSFSSWKGLENRKYIEKIPYFFSDKLEKKQIKKLIKFQDYLKRDLFSRTAVLKRYFSKGFTSKERGTSVLNTEELATLYHFPKALVFSRPSLDRILIKKSEIPNIFLYEDENEI